MNSSQAKTVVLICPSEVVLKGLSEILKGSQAAEILQLHRSDEVIDYPELTGNVVVIGMASELEKNQNFIKQVLSVAMGIQFLSLHFGDQPDANMPFISLFDSPSMICYKVNDVFDSFAITSTNETDTELTKREIEVLRLLAKGYSNKEIADHLFVSTHTVISHRKNISEKTGIKSASGLTMYAILKKIIDVSDINPAELV
jgi:DNA-binding NarL/FixJ family response regulator